jgi:anaerobic selenocysteine-containing dehydrogenase
MPQTVFRTCTLCEAMCGLAFEVEGDRIVSVGPDHDDVFSHGYICPKGTAYVELHDDPDRLRTPVRRTAAGTFEPISWDEAFSLIASKIGEIQAKHGRDAVAVYLGNPMVHNHSVLLLRAGLMRALRTKNSTSAGSQDTSPRFAASYYLYGASLAIPVPDIDRTDYFLCLGANPRVSNGSIMTAPNVRERIQAIRKRGGKVVVVDPRRTETARDADEHVSILPGGDAAMLFAMVNCLIENDRIDEAQVHEAATGWDAIKRLMRGFTPERASATCGVPAATIRRLADEFASARTAAAYSRVGVCNSRHGTIGSYATDLLNLVAGKLAVEGGSMFNNAAFNITPVVKVTKSDGHARWHTRVRKLPETLGDVPSAALAEEMETPGDGQVRAFLTLSGNPVLSTPNGNRLARALERLDFMVSVDPYINETTRHAHVILPPASSLTEDHVDVILSRTAVRDTVRWSPPVVARGPNERTDTEIMLELTYRLGGGPTGFRPLDWFYRHARRFGIHWKADSALDFVLRIGPYGDRFLPGSKGLNFKKLKRATHGVDLGPLKPGFNGALVHKDGKVHLDAPLFVRAIENLQASLDAPTGSEALVMIGRRELRSNNSWMHNVPSLMTGKRRCVLLVHPNDAERIGLRDGDSAILENDLHHEEVSVHVSDEMRPGVVCLPHGWGHSACAPWQKVASANPGVSFNNWSNDRDVEDLVGQSILNGVPVRLRALPPTTQSAANSAAGLSLAASE